MGRGDAGVVAERIVHENSLRIPIDPFALAEAEGIAVVAKPASAPGVSGFFMRVGGAFTIAYATHVANVGFQRFSVAHELGHYFLPGHIEHVLGVSGVHESRAGFTSKEPHEAEADEFASRLLLPTNQFRALVDANALSLVEIEQLAARCKTSLTATAIRTTQCARTAVAIVVCNQDAVEFAFVSSDFRKLLGEGWLRRNDPIPRRTATYEFVSDPRRILDAERTEGATAIHTWFGTGQDVELLEEVVGLGGYGKVLTVLTPQGHVPDDEERDEEDALVKSWQPTLSRRR